MSDLLNYWRHVFFRQIWQPKREDPPSEEKMAGLLFKVCKVKGELCAKTLYYYDFYYY